MTCRKSEVNFKDIANVLVKTILPPSLGIENKAPAENVMNIKVPSF